MTKKVACDHPGRGYDLDSFQPRSIMRFHEEHHGVYFDDLDAFRILHNARYLLLMERTIGSFWHHLGWGTIADDASNPDQHHLVRSQSVSYERPVRGTGRVRCRIWIEKLGRSSLQFAFAILPLDEDRAHATGTRTLVKIDLLTHQSTPWSDEFRARVGPYARQPTADAPTR